MKINSPPQIYWYFKISGIPNNWATLINLNTKQTTESKFDRMKPTLLLLCNFLHTVLLLFWTVCVQYHIKPINITLGFIMTKFCHDNFETTVKQQFSQGCWLSSLKLKNTRKPFPCSHFIAISLSNYLILIKILTGQFLIQLLVIN